MSSFSPKREPSTGRIEEKEASASRHKQEGLAGREDTEARSESICGGWGGRQAFCLFPFCSWGLAPPVPERSGRDASGRQGGSERTEGWDATAAGSLSDWSVWLAAAALRSTSTPALRSAILPSSPSSWRREASGGNETLRSRAQGKEVVPRRPLLNLQTPTRKAWQIVDKSSAVTMSSQGGPGARLHSDFASPKTLASHTFSAS